MSGYSTPISNTLEPLVNNLSDLILATVNDDIKGVQKCCLTLATDTNTVVGSVRKLALSSKDVDFQTMITDEIENITRTVTQLITDFKTFISSPLNPDFKRTFASTTKDFGEAVNQLLMATDKCACRKVVQHVDKAMKAGKALYESGVGIEDANTSAAELVRVVKDLITGTPDINKRNKLQSGLHDLEQAQGPYLETGRAREMSPSSSSVGDEMRVKFQVWVASCGVIKQVAGINALDTMGKLYTTYREAMYTLQQLASKTRDTAERFFDLMERIGDGTASTEEFVGAARELAQSGLDLVRKARETATMIDDPVLKRHLMDAADSVTALSSKVIADAKKYLQYIEAGDTEGAARAFEDLMKDREALNAAIQDLVNATKDLDEEGKFALTCQYLEREAEVMVNSAIGKNGEELVKRAKGTTQMVEQLVKDAAALASTPQHINDKPAIIDAAASVKKSTAILIDAASSAYKNEESHGDLEEAHRAFSSAMYRTKVICGMEEESSSNPYKRELTEEEEALVNAARDQSDIALRFADDAESLAKRLKGEEQKRVLQAVSKLRDLARKVLEAAEYAALNPEDPLAQKRLQQAQKDLAQAIQDIITLTCGDPSAGMTAALNAMREACSSDKDTEIFSVAGSVVSAIDAIFGGESTTLSPADLLAGTRDINSKASTVVKLLRQMARDTDDDEFAEQLRTFANIINDRSLQMKILAAVKASSGSSGMSAVAQAALGLKRSLCEALDFLHASSLKKRLAATINQVVALKEIADAYHKLV